MLIIVCVVLDHQLAVEILFEGPTTSRMPGHLSTEVQNTRVMSFVQYFGLMTQSFAILSLMQTAHQLPFIMHFKGVESFIH